MEFSPRWERTFCLIGILYIFSSRVSGETRCYCNEPSCVTTGYMCKTPNGRCYSKISVVGSFHHSMHGCTDSLSSADDSLNICLKAGNFVQQSDGDLHQKSFWQCCGQDMCNYMDSIDISIMIKNWNKTEDDQIDGGIKHINTNYVKSLKKDVNQELWFKAAVIAVPIAGGFILVLLVLLAMRMLRHDNRQQDKLKLTHHQETHHQKTKSYINHHFSSDNNKHIAKVHHNTKPIRNSVLVVQDEPVSKNNNGTLPSSRSHNDVSVSINCDEKREYSKVPVSDTEEPVSRSCDIVPVNSIVLWGNTSKSDVSVV